MYIQAIGNPHHACSKEVPKFNEFIGKQDIELREWSVTFITEFTSPKQNKTLMVTIY